jgi:alkanesulfonate monooxygenase SsuD/methylene tetrahydromethanopterin reductase-like flavin-dependent oxidoreductase (luciferase family)
MGVTAAACVEFGKRAEQLGFQSVWVPDRLVYPSPDIFVTLGALAAATSRVTLGSSVLLGVLRSPLLVTKAAIALKEISGGRLVLGLGAGSRTEDFEAVEVPLRERGKRLNALVRYLHETAPELPLWFGGRADAVLRRVARSGSGYIASTSSGVEGFASRWRTLQQYVSEAGREPGAVTPAALAHFSVDSDAARARERMHAYLTYSYGPDRAADLGPLTGSPDDLVRGADAYFKAGVEVLICSSITVDIGALEMFAERVLPRLYL